MMETSKSVDTIRYAAVNEFLDVDKYPLLKPEDPGEFEFEQS